MSTFDGKILQDNFDFFYVDDFTKFDRSLYLLSHFHTDHFRGLFDRRFATEWTEKNFRIICSELTKKMILAHPKCQIESQCIEVIHINKSINIRPKDSHKVCHVTAIPAGHCPGSVMFLFEQDNVTVLYTGDFRLNSVDLRRINAFHGPDRNVKTIDAMYLDTTFFDPKWENFPSRDESLEDLKRVVLNWLEDPSHEVGIQYNSYHGLEFIVMGLGNELKKISASKIWMPDEEAFKVFSITPELNDVIINDKGSSRVHLCPVWQVVRYHSCEYCLRSRGIKRIKLCAMSFDQMQLACGRVSEGPNLTKIAYSLHSSHEEVRHFIKYLKPHKIYSCALPMSVSKSQMRETMKRALEEAHEINEEPGSKRRCIKFEVDCTSLMEDPVTVSVAFRFNTEMVPFVEGPEIVALNNEDFISNVTETKNTDAEDVILISSEDSFVEIRNCDSDDSSVSIVEHDEMNDDDIEDSQDVSDETDNDDNEI